MPLIVPVRARHVATAYEEASTGPDAFRQREMQWLLEHHTILHKGIADAYAENMGRIGPALGTPYLIGSTIGHRAVRLCTEETGDYQAARTNYQHNTDVATRLQTEGPWNTVGVLDRVLGDHDLSESMMRIKHDITRASAAAVIGFLSLDMIPEVPTMDLEFENLNTILTLQEGAWSQACSSQRSAGQSCSLPAAGQGTSFQPS